MTSRNLCFKLMREDLKRRLWTVAFSIVSMVFALVVPVAMQCSNFSRELADMSLSRRYSQMNRIVTALWFNIPVILILMVSSVLWAVSGFQYLHNRQKVDFYHSIPVKRHQLFLAAYANGILVPLACYALAQAASVCFLLSAGIGPDRIGSLPWQSLLINSVYYCLIYTTVVIAMMMTGHVVVALLGAGVFFGYGPAAVGLGVLFCENNFRTWLYGMGVTRAIDLLLMRLLRYTSPLVNYILALEEFTEGTWSLWRALPVLLVTAAFALLAYGLYRLRASEAAGRAMAFEKTRAVIRILITIPVGIAGGMFLGDFVKGVGWLAFGTICGVLLTHCLMEIIYHFDFRKLFANRYQLVLCAVLALAANVAGYYDLFGYDSWYPEADEIVDATVYEPNAGSWITYGEVEFEEAGNNDADYMESLILDAGREYDGHYVWNYDSGNHYRMSNMKLTDAYTVSELARRSAENEKQMRFKQGYHSGYRTIYLRVKLKSGRQVYRMYNYAEASGESEELFRSILESAEYKKGIYPVMDQTAEDLAAVYFMQNGSSADSPMELDAAGREAVLAAFQQDMLDMTFETMAHELPIGTIQFRTQAHEEAIRYNNELLELVDSRAGMGFGDLTGRCVYPVYPSFTRTLALLEEAGVEIRTLADEDITGIDIYYYGNQYRMSAEQEEVNADGTEAEGADAEELPKAETEHAVAEDVPKAETISFEGEVKYDDPEDIQALAPGLVYSEYVWMNSDYYDRKNLADGVNVSVRIRRNGTHRTAAGEYNGQWTEELDCELDLSKLPSETAQKYGLWN